LFLYFLCVKSKLQGPQIHKAVPAILPFSYLFRFEWLIRGLSWNLLFCWYQDQCLRQSFRVSVKETNQPIRNQEISRAINERSLNCRNPVGIFKKKENQKCSKGDIEINLITFSKLNVFGKAYTLRNQNLWLLLNKYSMSRVTMAKGIISYNQNMLSGNL